MPDHDMPGLSDPLWDYILTQRLNKYIPAVRKWWSEVASLSVTDTGAYDINAPEAPGLAFRFTRVAIRSPIKGIQAFPFVPAGFLQISGIQGGSTKMIERVCRGDKFTIEEFTIIEKHNLPSVINAGQIVCFIPTDIIKNRDKISQWIYLTKEEMTALAQLEVPPSVVHKVMLKL